MKILILRIKLKSKYVTQELLDKCENIVVLNNNKIISVNHPKLLENLDISGFNCSVDQRGISKLKNIKILDNPKIINHLKFLE